MKKLCIGVVGYGIIIVFVKSYVAISFNLQDVASGRVITTKGKLHSIKYVARFFYILFLKCNLYFATQIKKALRKIHTCVYTTVVRQQNIGIMIRYPQE